MIRWQTAASRFARLLSERQALRVATTCGPAGRPPLLLFNGIGANWQLAKPFIQALTDTAVIIFDMPGIGGSPLPALPYRPSTLARLAAGLVRQLGHQQVDVAGVSWGGGIAQQFAHQHPAISHRLVLAATSPGAIMVPGRLSVLMKLATPRRYVDPGYMRSIAAEIYGGAFRDNPELIATHARGDVWREQPRLFVPAPGHERVDQLALARDIAATNTGDDGPGRSAGPADQWPHSGEADPQRPSAHDRRRTSVHGDAGLAETAAAVEAFLNER